MASESLDPIGRPGFLDGLREFFRSEHARPSGLDLYDDVFADAFIFPLQRRRELRQMIRLARLISPRVVGEIGVDKAGGFYHWIKCFPDVRKAVGIELRGCPYAELFKEYFPDVDFLFVGKSCRANETVATVRQFLGHDLFDVLFLDGEKADALKDFRLYRRLVRPGGIIFLHDIFDVGTQAAFGKITQSYRTETIIDRSESREAIDRNNAGFSAVTHYETWLRHWKGASACVGVIHMPQEKKS